MKSPIFLARKAGILSAIFSFYLFCAQLDEVTKTVLQKYGISRK